MAHRIWHEVQTAKRSRRVVSGSFAPAGAGNVTDRKGAGVSTDTQRFAVGEFSVFLQDAYVDAESITCGLQLAAATDRFVRITSITQAFVVGNRIETVFTLKVTDGANAAQDIAADPNNRINFTYCLRDN